MPPFFSAHIQLAGDDLANNHNFSLLSCLLFAGCCYSYHNIQGLRCQ